MLVSTKGIVIKTFTYSETSIVARIYTKALGTQTYIISGVRTAKAKVKPALLQPLSLLDMVVYSSANKKMHRTKELRPAYVFKQIPFVIPKTVLAVFISELLYKSLKEEGANVELFTFLEGFVQFLDATDQSVANLHLLFMLKLSAYLGFLPYNNYKKPQRTHFNLQEGSFQAEAEQSFLDLSKAANEHLAKMLSLNFNEAQAYSLSRAHRQELLRALVKYYQLQIEDFGELKSLKVLEAVMA